MARNERQERFVAFSTKRNRHSTLQIVLGMSMNPLQFGPPFPPAAKFLCRRRETTTKKISKSERQLRFCRVVRISLYRRRPTSSAWPRRSTSEVRLLRGRLLVGCVQSVLTTPHNKEVPKLSLGLKGAPISIFLVCLITDRHLCILFNYRLLMLLLETDTCVDALEPYHSLHWWHPAVLCIRLCKLVAPLQSKRTRMVSGALVCRSTQTTVTRL